MAYYLDSLTSASTRYATIPAVTFPGDFEIKVIAAQLGTSPTFIFAGSGVAGQQGIDLYRTTSGNYQLFINNTSAISTTTAVTNNITTPDTVIVRRLSGVVDLIINGVSRGTFSTSATLAIERLFHRNGWSNYGRMGLYEFTITFGGSYNTSWNPSNSPSGGSAWTSSNGQVMTQAGSWPSDNSEWVFYSSGGTSWEGTIGKTSLSVVTKALSINTGQSLSPNKVTLTVSSKQQSISTGFVATNGKTSLTLSPKQEAINVGYINTLSKLGLVLLQKQLSITVGANLPFTGVIGKTTYTLNGKQLGLALGWSGGVNKRNLSPITKQLNIAAGWNSGVVKSTLPVSNKQESVLAGFVNTINEINIPVNGKPLNLQTGTSISYVGTINKGSLNVSGKPLNVVAGTSIPFVGLMQKTSLTLTGKQLGVVRGQVLDLQKQALNIVGKQLSLGEIVYPIVPIERVFTIKDGDRIHYFKQTTTVYIMKNN